MDRKSFLSKTAFILGSIPLLGMSFKEKVSAAVNDNAKISAKNVQYRDTTVADSLTELNNNLTASDGCAFRFATDGEGGYGYLDADNSFVPFKSAVNYFTADMAYSVGGSALTFPHKATYIVVWGNPASVSFAGSDFTIDANYGWTHHGPGMAYGAGTAVITTLKDNVTVTVTNWSTSYDINVIAIELLPGIVIQGTYSLAPSVELPIGTYIVNSFGGTYNGSQSFPSDKTVAMYRYNLGSGNLLPYDGYSFWLLEVYSSPVTFSLGSYYGGSKLFQIQ